MKLWLTLPIILAVGLAPMLSAAPPADDNIIASWPKELSRGMTENAENSSETQQDKIERASEYLARASQPGQSRFYDRAQLILEPLLQGSEPSAEVWYLWATIQQHQHQFEAALSALDSLFTLEPAHISGRLLAARIELVRNRPDVARGHCLAILGVADLYTTSACALEVASVASDLDASYKQLSQLIERDGLPEDERGPWLAQMLADMAARQGEYQAADAWLMQKFTNADVSYLAQWADVQLSLNRPIRVIRKLEPIVKSSINVDESLLLRLAIAEKTEGGSYWQEQLADRIEVRVRRQDVQHAGEIARYFLEIDPQPKQALRWAEINWSKAREPSDQELLAKAREIHAKQAEQEL